MGKILVTGCGLGGTHYAARVLQKCGLDVKHERIRSDGVVSFGHATWVDPVAREQALTCGETQWVFNDNSPDADVFDVVLRQTRNPRKVASSIGHTATSSTWAKLLRAVEARFEIELPWPPGETEREKMEAGVAYTYWYYAYAGLHARWTYRVENMATALPDILHAAEHEISEDAQKRALDTISTKTGSRQSEREYKYWSWPEIVNVKWGPQLKAMARAFGYFEG